MSRKDAVGVEIRRAIVLGRLKPGDRLTEAQLAESLRVSRATVRESLNQLAREGLVIQEPYRGLRVADLSGSQLRDIAVTRVALDMVAIDAILADGTGERMSEVDRVWRRFERDAADPDALAQHEAHIAFHRDLWIASGNHLLMSLWPVTEAHITIALAEDQTARSDPERAHRLHRQLVDAIHTRDRAIIEAAFIAHTIDSADELTRLLAQEEAAS